MSSASTLFINISSNYAGIAVQIVIAFVLSPFLVHTMGHLGVSSACLSPHRG
jgi:hypothetical protein